MNIFLFGCFEVKHWADNGVDCYCAADVIVDALELFDYLNTAASASARGRGDVSLGRNCNALLFVVVAPVSIKSVYYITVVAVADK